MNSVIETKKTEKELTISIPAGELTQRQVQRLVDLVRAESIVGKSRLTQNDTDEIAADINRSWWKKNKARIEKMIGENE